MRRAILELLQRSPLPAGNIAAHFTISRPAISRHLRVLVECGAVEVTTSGRQRVYELRTAPFLELAEYVDRLVAPPFAHGLDALATEVARTRRERRDAAAGAHAGHTPGSGHEPERQRKQSA